MRKTRNLRSGVPSTQKLSPWGHPSITWDMPIMGSLPLSNDVTVRLFDLAGGLRGFDGTLSATIPPGFGSSWSMNLT